jgi:N6-adenosine-specific RNA methylase IME4
MPLADIAAIPVQDWAKRDCILGLWATWPKLDEAMDLIPRWGFKHVTGFPWVKTVPNNGAIRRGVGHWSMGCTEPFLIARRGEPKRNGVPVLGLLTGEDRSFWAPNVGHSVKPYGVHEWLEEIAEGPFLELFARREYPGWSTWGYDTGFRLSASGVEPVAGYQKPRPAQPDLFGLITT